MSNSDTSISRFYQGWRIYNERIVEVVRALETYGDWRRSS